MSHENTLHPEQHHLVDEQEFVRRSACVHDLAQAGIPAWGAQRSVTATCAQVKQDWMRTETAQTYILAGRLMTVRVHGKTLFAHIQDRSGKVQLYVTRDLVGAERFDWWQKNIDLGDIIWCSGESFVTKTGEVSIRVNDFSLLSKCLHSLPEKFHGITDREVKYRQRYLDLMTSPETRERFVARSRIISGLRHFLDSHDFLEVETPMLHPIPGGAAARPFITHHNALGSDFYLRIAPELYLKRLVVGGFERVYEINRNFRNEGVSTRHNPEFTMLEFYMAHQEYQFIMGFVEDLIRTVISKSCGTLIVPFGDKIIDFSKPFARMTMREAIEHIGGHAVSPRATGAEIVALFEETTEKKITDPTYIIDFPIEISPLAQRDPHRPHVAARFELFIAGMEISNGFNELHDPFDQAERFKQQAAAHAAGDVEAMHYDADYIRALEYGLPPTVGVGIGIDRLVMLATNTTSIKEVILFPTLKRQTQ